MRKDKIKEMIDFVYYKINEKDEYQNESLMQGLGGDILFLFYYYKLFNKKKSFEFKIERLLAFINQNHFPLFTFGDGLSGVSWVLSHINNELKLSPFNPTISYEGKIRSVIEMDIKNSNYDLLHGLIGHYIYLLEANPNNELFEHNNIIEMFLNMTKTNETNAKEIWADSSNGKAASYINLGLAHGLPSILVFFIKFYEISNNPRYINLIEQVFNYLIGIKRRITNNGNLFPSFEELKDGSTEYLERNAWCYGDIGILISLCRLNSINIINTSILDNLIEELIASNVKRTKENSTILDSSLCHGATGIALLYSKLINYLPEDIRLKKAFSYWMEHVYEDFDSENKLKSYDKKSNTFKNDFTLLNGFSGIGLSLMSIYFEEDLGWEKFILLK